jgi:hypothetical protein
MAEIRVPGCTECDESNNSVSESCRELNMEYLKTLEMRTVTILCETVNFLGRALHKGVEQGRPQGADSRGTVRE